MNGFSIGKILSNLQHPTLLFKRLNNVQQNNTQDTALQTFNQTANEVKQNAPQVLRNNQNTQQPSANNINNNPQTILQNNQDVRQTDAKIPIEKITTKTNNTNISADRQSNWNINQPIQNIETITQQIQQFNFQSSDKSIFVKNLLGLPQNLGQALLLVQNPNNPLNGGTLGLTNVNQAMLQQNPILSTLFSEESPSQSTTTKEVMAQIISNIEQQATQIQQTNKVLFFSGMISMPEISKLILHNSKQAVAALIIAMASASRHGASNDPLQETLSIINSCISMAETNNPAMTLKSLMMLYIPWLPLNEGVGFDLEISQQTGEEDSNDSKLTILIQTKNYGNIKGVFTLTTTNSVDAYIICTDTFPKKQLQEYLNQESSSHAMNTNIDIEDIKPQKDEINETQETKVNLSATNEMNPYLLLMAHAFIRGVVSIDNNLTELPL